MLSVRQIFNPMLFVIHRGVLCYNRHTDPTKPYNALHVCVPAVKVKETFKICHEGMSAGQRGTVARVLIREHFSLFGLPNQIHSDNGHEFVNKLWVELFMELKILHTKTPPYNPSSNILERWHRTIVIILRMMGGEMQNEWDLESWE